MPQILDADDLGTHDPFDKDDAPSSYAPGFSWETITRCLVVGMVVGMVVMLSWRPAMLRFSQLMFVVSPSHGDSLAWKAEDDTSSRPASRKHTLAPAEWRLTPGVAGKWSLSKESAAEPKMFRNTRLLGDEWRRFSFNPWSWQDDATAFLKKRSQSDLVEPEQKAVTEYRTRDGESWVITDASPAPTPVPPITEATSAPERTVASGTPEPLEIPALHPIQIPSTSGSSSDSALRGKGDDTRNEKAVNEGKISLDEVGRGMLELPPLSFDFGDMDRDLAGIRDDGGDVGKILVPEESIPGIPGESREELETKEADSRELGSVDDEDLLEVDWADTEITRAIPGAYLTIYPKLKFIGLCVPGQGYIRKYNQVAMPRDTESPKLEAGDGCTPYGKYYIASRGRGDGEMMELMLSWPSPDDAKRIGLLPGEVLDIENAWLGQGLPPQGTRAGGGVRITGDRDRVEETAGGFSLEEPHFEEISTALPDGAWVFVQP